MEFSKIIFCTQAPQNTGLAYYYYLAAKDLLSTDRVVLMDEGSVSLRELAEEELLLALPVIAACSTPEVCGRAPAPDKRQRPFAVLQDLLKKT